MIEIIAHRGASHDAPENTLAAFQRAWEQGADAIECDVHLSKDGQIVVFHDASTKRIGGVDALVIDQTLAELKGLDAGRWKGDRFAGERIPTLAEMLATIPVGKRAYVEVKCGPEIVPEFKRVLAATNIASEQVVVIAFSMEVVARVKRELPDVKALWIVDLRKQLWSLEELIATAKSIRADGLDLSAYPAITREFVEAANTAGLPVLVWTVDEPAAARQLIEAGVAGIATNRPGWLRAQLGDWVRPNE